jgi:hypothetical protein
LARGKAPEPAEVIEVMHRNGLEPLEAYVNARTPWLCLCVATGKQTSPRFDKVKRQDKHVCVWCRPNAAVDPDVACQTMLARDLEPLDPYPGRNDEPWRCRCLRCGSEVKPLYGHVQQGKSRACQTCKSVTCRELRLSETDPNQAVAEMRAAGFEPLEPFHGTNAYWACKCIKCGAPSRPRLNTLRQRGGRCGDCAPRRGFKPNKAALVYLVYHGTHHAIKVGLGNVDGRRLEAHRACGWVALAVEYVSGEQASAIEKNILSWWRKDLSLPHYLSKSEMPQGGWTETVDADAVDIPATIARVRELAAA